jgi:hypothetical protein
MFGFILELLNEEGPQAFFNLLKGDRQATVAQKEKKHLACKRNCTLRCDCHRLAEEAAEGHPSSNAMGADASSLLAKWLRDTDALLQKGQVEGW